MPDIGKIGYDFVVDNQKIAMPNKGFIMEFTYNGNQYLGVVRPFIAAHRTFYKVTLETEHMQDQLELVLKPSNSDLHSWEFECDDRTLVHEFDQYFFDRIGEEVSQSLSRISEEHV